MASSLAVKRLVQNSAVLRRGAEVARQEIFGHLPQLNIQSGHKKAKVQFTGPYLERYYPESINKFARQVSGFEGDKHVSRVTINQVCSLLPGIAIAGSQRLGDGSRGVSPNQIDAAQTKGQGPAKERIWVTIQEKIDHIPATQILKFISLHYATRSLAHLHITTSSYNTLGCVSRCNVLYDEDITFNIRRTPWQLPWLQRQGGMRPSVWQGRPN